VDVPEIEIEQFESLVTEGAAVLDVREPHEWDEGYIDGALLVSLADVPECIDDLPEDAPVYVVCRTGSRSRHVTEYLMKQGLDAYNVAGGIVAWVDAGHSLRTDRPSD
jgi:rhodanese-related sulfurtransferase